MFTIHFFRGLAIAMLALAFVLCHAEENRDCSKERLRACGSNFVLYANTTRIAETTEELRQACQLWTSQIECSLKYIDDCLDGTTRGTCMVVLKAAEEDFEAVCTEGNEMERLYLQSSPCGNAAGSKLNVCVRNMFRNLQKATEKAAPNQAVYHACCYFGELLDCVDASLGDCNNTAESKEFIMGRLEHVFGEAFSLVCGTYTRGSASCATLPVLPELDPGAAEPVNNLVEYGILVMQLLGRRSADTPVRN
uniref:Putative conserved secreted protein midgut overexpressed n=1 Tax=Rhipicephalus microplus TaxID=6941 RepID=A0A034WXC6_RHIMP